MIWSGTGFASTWLSVPEHAQGHCWSCCADQDGLRQKPTAVRLSAFRAAGESAFKLLIGDGSGLFASIIKSWNAPLPWPAMTEGAARLLRALAMLLCKALTGAAGLGARRRSRG